MVDILTGSQQLFYGARSGLVQEITTAVNEKGGDVNEQDALGNTPIHYAATYGNTDAIKELVDFGADVNVPNNVGNTPLHNASFRGHLSSVKALLGCGADKTLTNRLGQTPADLAYAYPEVLECLGGEGGGACQ